MVALAGERNSLLREIVARMAAKELHDERLIALEEERLDLMRQLLGQQVTDTGPPTGQVQLRSLSRAGGAKRRRA
jgi:hypothetical protein